MLSSSVPMSAIGDCTSPSEFRDRTVDRFGQPRARSAHLLSSIPCRVPGALREALTVPFFRVRRT